MEPSQAKQTPYLSRNGQFPPPLSVWLAAWLNAVGGVLVLAVGLTILLLSEKPLWHNFGGPMVSASWYMLTASAALFGLDFLCSVAYRFELAADERPNK